MDLAIFEAKALAQALTDSGHAVSERTVQRWKRGQTKPKPQDIRAIREMLGIQNEAAPPDWAERLLAGTMALEAKEAITDVELAAAQAKAAAYLAVAHRRRPSRAGGGDESG